MNIFIVTKEPFPTGLAATNRIRAYAKGFIEHGSRVTILCLGPTEYHHTVFNPHPSGIVDGIRFRYAGGKTRISSYFLKRRIDNAIGTLRACIHVWVKKPQVVIYYSSATTPALLLYGITRLRKILFLKEESELPVVYARTMPRLRKMLFERVHYTLFDGMLLMTRRLINYFTKEKGMESPYLRVPMTVDCERFTLVIVFICHSLRQLPKSELMLHLRVPPPD